MYCADGACGLDRMICSIAAILHFMKTTLTITNRGGVTLPVKLPVELFTPEREREFDEAEADLAARQENKVRRAKTTAKPRR